MKKIFIICVVLICVQNTFSQNSNELNDIQKEVYDNEVVQVKAEFPNGVQKFREYVLMNLKAPFNKVMKGEILVRFIVEIDGTIRNVDILNSLSDAEGDEIKRVLTNSPKWLPAEHEGYRVKSKIKFTLKL
jgi:protein TonB